MGAEKYFRDEWWDMMGMYDDPERRKQLNKDGTEVLYEMVYQEYQSGRKAEDVAAEFGLHPTTVWRIARRHK